MSEKAVCFSFYLVYASSKLSGYRGMKEPFYSSGLRFQCQRCSRCCRFEPGYVFLSQVDLERLARTTRCTTEQFINTYCRTIEINGFKRLSLKEKANYDCIFWENGDCIVYEQRPLQCKSYPFWSPHITSEEAWNALGQSCPGVNKGPYYSKEQIDYWLWLRTQEPFVVVS
jgi:Fe-S-cluster containining protein